MTCDELRDFLSPYMDGQLAAAEAECAAAHLSVCPSCREELAALRFTSGLVSALPQEALGVDLAPRAVARASASAWRERLAALRDLLAPRRASPVRAYLRAAAVLAVFVLAAAAPGTRIGGLLISWPVRVAGAAETGIAYLAAGVVQARTFLSGAGQAQLASHSPSSTTGKQRSPALRQSGRPSGGALV